MENNEHYPLVSFCLVAYKEEKYIRDAIKGAFSQDYPNLEIILSDDGSPDRTYEIMQEMASEYKGPHKIILNQNKPNLGPRDHYCKVLYELSKGEFVVLADGDDISLPQRTKVSVDFMLSHPEVSALSLKDQYIDEDGNKMPHPADGGLNLTAPSIFTLEDFVKFNLYCFSSDSRVMRRNAIDAFPPLKYSFAEDIYFFLRSLYVGSYAYLRASLVLYRQRTSSLMGQSRAKTYISKADIEKFENTTARQLREDLRYALENEIVTPLNSEKLNSKLEQFINGLRPAKKTIITTLIKNVGRKLLK